MAASIFEVKSRCVAPGPPRASRAAEKTSALRRRAGARRRRGRTCALTRSGAAYASRSWFFDPIGGLSRESARAAPKPGDPRHAVRADEHVLRPELAVAERRLVLVRGDQRGEHVERDAQHDRLRASPCAPAAGDQRGEDLAVVVLGDDVELAAGVADLDEADGVRVAELGRGPWPRRRTPSTTSGFLREVLVARGRPRTASGSPRPSPAVRAIQADADADARLLLEQLVRSRASRRTRRLFEGHGVRMLTGTPARVNHSTFWPPSPRPRGPVRGGEGRQTRGSGLPHGPDPARRGDPEQRVGLLPPPR